MTRRLCLTALLLPLAALLAPPAAAEHAQVLPSGQTLTFDHAGGNAWWVEVRLGGTEGPWIVVVEARDTNGPWVTLDKKPWGAWAASFPIEPGHTVTFRATTRGGVTLESCAFTHPDGREACGARATGTFDATFTNPRGNAWWIETGATATGGSVTQVEASVDGGPWIALQRTTWGSWARSAPVPPGASVRFRALSDAGAADLSAAYPWPPPR